MVFKTSTSIIHGILWYSKSTPVLRMVIYGNQNVNMFIWYNMVFRTCTSIVYGFYILNQFCIWYFKEFKTVQYSKQFYIVYYGNQNLNQ